MTGRKAERGSLRVPLGLAVLVLLFAASPLSAYVGPGAGFAFLSSFLVMFLAFFMAVFSFLSWPFRVLRRALRGRKAYGRSRVDRLIILGLDGLEPTLVEKFMAEGKLPNFSRMKKEGYYSPLATTTPAISPVAWSSFMTGCEPSKHNIFDFLDRDPRTYLPGLSSARIREPKKVLPIGKYNIPLSKPVVEGMRRSVPFWNILGRHGIFSTVLRVPITFPPEKFNGHLFSGMCTPDLKGSQGTFTFYTEDKARAGEHEGGVMVAVERSGELISTVIHGPENTLLRRPVELTVPLTIDIDREKKGAWIGLPGQRFFLPEKKFSAWTNVVFKPGLGMKVHSICRFYIRSMAPFFEMYMTPLNMDPGKPALPISHPFIYSVYLSKLLGKFITLGEANDTWALNEGALDDKAFLELTYLNHADWEAMFKNALKKTPRGLTAIVFETTDSIQHMFLRYLDKTHPSNRTVPGPDKVRIIEDLYVKMDGLVGDCLSGLGEKDVLFIMSDHGFKLFSRGVNLNSWLYRNGYLALREGASESGEWFHEVDWDRTRAYALGLGGLYINLRGREARGIVEPGAEEAKVKAELITRLGGLIDPDKGKVSINRIYDCSKIYAGPYRENGPDLVVGYNLGYRASWDGVKGRVDDIVFSDNDRAWSGDHCIDPAVVPGVFFSSAWIEQCRSLSIMDIAPTSLELFGIEPPAHMDGKSFAKSIPAMGGLVRGRTGQKDEKPKGGKNDVRK